MDTSFVYTIYNELKSDNLSLVYQGDFTDDAMSKILNLSDNNIDNYQELTKLKRKVSFILVESFQNIVRHKGTTDQYSSFFLIRNIGKDYIITSVNVIEKAKVEALSQKLYHINELEKEELKNYYIDQLSNSEFSSKGGAGLGLIEMARSSGNKLEFDFESIDPTRTSFYLKIKITRSIENTCIEENTAHSTFNFVKVIRRQMLNHNILMTYKGDFSQNSILPILKMIEDNHFTKESELRLQKRIFIVLVEMLQNISKHAVEELTNQGIFLIGIDKEDKYFISTGNLIKKHNVEQLESHLNQVNNLDQSQLNLLYRQTLRNGKLSDSGGAGLGIIDMARESSNKLEFKFVDCSADLSFFSLKIII